MTFVGTALAQTTDLSPLTDACGDDPSFLCEQMFDWTDNTFLAGAADWMLDRPIRIILILVVAWVLSRLLKRFVARFVARVASSPRDERFQALREMGPGRLLIEETERKRAAWNFATLGPS